MSKSKHPQLPLSDAILLRTHTHTHTHTSNHTTLCEASWTSSCHELFHFYITKSNFVCLSHPCMHRLEQKWVWDGEGAQVRKEGGREGERERCTPLLADRKRIKSKVVLIQRWRDPTWFGLFGPWHRHTGQLKTCQPLKVVCGQAIQLKGSCGRLNIYRHTKEAG